MSDVNKTGNENISPERVFLHDIASPLSIIRLVLNKLSEDISSAGSPELMANTQRRIDKAREALMQIEILHANRKEQIHQIESKKAL